MTSARTRWPLLAFVIVLMFALSVAPQSGHAQRVDVPGELATTIADGFTIASVGDLIVAYPATYNPDPGFKAVAKLIQDADVATANWEASVIDGRKFKGSSIGPQAGTPDVPKDMKTLGFDLVARSANHVGEFGAEGWAETNARIEDAGLVYAGSGDTYWAARAPRFFSSTKGRVGMVATASSFAQNMMAMPSRGEWPGRGGQSALRTTQYYVVPPSIWEAITTIRGAFPTGGSLYPPVGERDNQVQILGRWFRRESVNKTRFSYEMNKDDLRDILAMVREGKAKSDFMTVAIHSHETTETEDVDIAPTPGDFLPIFAKAAIDAGADAFMGTGVHVLRGIEIYKGRPIFYGLGEFFRQMDTDGIAATGCTGEGGGWELDGSRPCRGDRNSEPIKYEGILAVSRFEHGTLAEIRLFPTDLNYGARMAHRGVPHLASNELAQRTLTRLQKLSAPYGTSIAIEGSIGVIRPRPATAANQP
jgi:poly-gamma-glutamate capsule biosynthesis protein CapA/YwtB (metallophosphatase superfamily)